jgi:hypothetical protein
VVDNWVKVKDTLLVVFFVIILQLFHNLIGLTIHRLEWFRCVVSCVLVVVFVTLLFHMLYGSWPVFCLCWRHNVKLEFFALRASIDMSHIAHVNTCLFMIRPNSVKRSECL